MDELRKQFEAWFSVQFPRYDFERYSHRDLYVEPMVQGCWEAWQEATKQQEATKASTWLPVETMPKTGKFLIGVWEGDLWQPRRRFQVYEATGFKERPVWSASYREAEGECWEIVGWMSKPEATKQAKGEINNGNG